MAVETAPTNGHHPPEPLSAQQLSWQEENVEHEGHVQALIADLTIQLVEEQRSLARIEATVAGYREREKRLAKAIAVLKGEPLGAGRPKAAEGDSKHKKQKTWISDEKVEAVRAALAGLGAGGHTVMEITEHVDFTDQSVRSALSVLREREQVRVARQENRQRWWALMPNAETSSGS